MRHTPATFGSSPTNGYELCNTERLAAGLPTEDNGDGIHTPDAATDDDLPD